MNSRDRYGREHGRYSSEPTYIRQRLLDRYSTTESGNTSPLHAYEPVAADRGNNMLALLTAQDVPGPPLPLPWIPGSDEYIQEFPDRRRMLPRQEPPPFLPIPFPRQGKSRTFRPPRQLLLFLQSFHSRHPRSLQPLQSFRRFLFRVLGKNRTFRPPRRRQSDRRRLIRRPPAIKSGATRWSAGCGVGGCRRRAWPRPWIDTGVARTWPTRCAA
jgi:hypothetical protein